MTRSRTPRFNLWRWSSESDTQSRSDFDDITAEIEARGALDSEVVHVEDDETIGGAKTFTYAVTADAGVLSDRMRARASIIGATETTTSTSYVDLISFGPEVTFIAPPSGVVWVHFSVEEFNTSGYAIAAPQVIRTSDSAVVMAAGEDLAAKAPLAAAATTISNAGFLTGLTPGTEYRSRLRYRCTSGTASFANRRLTAVPIP